MPKKNKSLTKPQNHQKLQDTHNLFTKYPIWTAIGSIILTSFLGWGLSIILPNIHDGIFIILVGLLISSPFFFRAYKLWAHRNTKKRIWVIIIAVVIAGVALLGTHLQFTQPKPHLRIDFDTPSTYVHPDGQIEFRIVNKGDRTAYQYQVTIFVAPENELQKVITADIVPGTSSIEPNESDYCKANIPQSTTGNGVWYLYYKLEYRDSSSGGHLYSDDLPYWLSCDFLQPKNGFAELSLKQIDRFKIAIEALYTGKDLRK